MQRCRLRRPELPRQLIVCAGSTARALACDPQVVHCALDRAVARTLQDLLLAQMRVPHRWAHVLLLLMCLALQPALPVLWAYVLLLLLLLCLALQPVLLVLLAYVLLLLLLLQLCLALQPALPVLLAYVLLRLLRLLRRWVLRPAWLAAALRDQRTLSRLGKSAHRGHSSRVAATDPHLNDPRPTATDSSPCPAAPDWRACGQACDDLR